MDDFINDTDIKIGGDWSDMFANATGLALAMVTILFLIPARLTP